MCRASKSKDDQAGQDFALPRLIRRYSRRNRMSLPFQRPTDHRRATQYKGGRLVNCPTIHGDRFALRDGTAVRCACSMG